MAFANLRTDERIGLAVAVLLHVALFAVLLLQPVKDEVPPLPERMTVSLATDVGLEATAPEPVPESRAAIAPQLGEAPMPEPAPADVAPPIPAPQPVATAAPPTPQPQPRAKPAAKAPAKPQPRASSAPPKPKAAAAPRTPAKTATPPKPKGGSKIGADFLPGAGVSTSTAETRVPASQIGASAKASLAQAIARQLKPHWNAPQGVDAEQLVTVLAFNLNPDGSLAGRPRVVSQSGETASNAPQKDLHAERAIRAVQLAAPFDLPPEYYEAWKRVSSFRFDRKL